jgi:DNA polymerase-1
MGSKNIYLIDATAFCYRAFYAIRGLSTSFGQPTNAVYGFVNILNKILKEKKPDYMAVCFDVSRDTFRTKKFKDYKIHRPAMPEGLSSQIPLIKQIISAYRIAVVEKEGFEADDVIATIVKNAKEKGLSSLIVSSDKDILQLVDEDTVVFSPYKDTGMTYDRKTVYAHYGVEPQRITDIIALMGDDVDNIPGVPGIGEKTAKELISSFGSLEQLLHNLDKVRQEKIRNILKDNIERIKLNKELAELNKDIEIDFNLEKLKVGKPDYKELFRLFKYLEFKSLLKDIPLEEEGLEGTRPIELKDKDLKNVIKQGQDLILCGNRLDDLSFFAGNKFFRIKGPYEELRVILEDAQIKKVSHDLKRIKISLHKEDINLEGLYFDTMVAAYLLNPSKSEYDLASVSWDYLGIPIGNKITESHRCINLILKLKPRLEKELQQKELFNLFTELEMPLVGVLSDMELTGIKLDLSVLGELSHNIEKRLIKLIEDIYELSGTQFNINSPMQLGEILFERLKLPIIKRSKTGPSTDEEVLRTLARQHKLPQLLLEYRKLSKLKNTYIDTLPDLVDKKTSRIHTSFNQTGTETGRLSSSNPNLQNIPIKTDIGKNIRRAIIASGTQNYLLSCDYSQIELRILAHLSKDENLILAFKKGIDIHKSTASLIYGIEENNVSSEMRDIAKRVNFGIIYGFSSYGLGSNLGISVEEAQAFIDNYFLRYPKVREYIKEQIKKAKEFGFVTTILGRRRYIPQINNKNQSIRQFAERQAINTPIQGSASDLIKLAMLKIHNELKKRNLKAKMVLQIHDELLFDLAKKELKELIGLLREKMENVLKLEVPIKIEIKKGKNWLEMESVE